MEHNSNGLSMFFFIVFIGGFCWCTALAQQQKACAVNCKLTGQPQNVTCALDPESMEGPYYLPLHLLRSNITEDRTGVPLKLHLSIMDSNTCQAVESATVDLWHADAYGVYSGYGQATGSTFLRGIQTTNTTGDVTFDTIYPGNYDGRCVHIHIEVYVGGTLKHTSQLYFHETISESVRIGAEPYASRKNVRITTVEKDHLYKTTAGVETTFDNVQGDVKSGFVAAIYIGINLEAVLQRGALDHGRGRNPNST